RHDVTVEDRRVVVEFARATHGVPAAARRLVGDEITIVQEEQWHAADAAQVTMSIPGKPGEISGTTTLRAQGPGTVQHVDLRIQVRVPLVGAKIEAFIASMLEKALDRENETGRAWLAEQGGTS
ncbi:DUF2505 domain-containing protein, partial [Nocardioides sp.]|uniref:DUF2505 domain-containing protein n=1 Tax=Nocardioides sp. TaxID=35761 RepID=UPI00273364DC